MAEKESFYSLAIVVVTYKRQELLKELLKSINELTVAPQHLIIVDNENSEDTEKLISSFEFVDTDLAVHYLPQKENTGGSGGFSCGVDYAYKLGVNWIWVMDDDVAVLPDAIEKLRFWMPKFKVIQGQRYNYNGDDFYWQYRFNTTLGIPNPIANSSWHDKKTVNVIDGKKFKKMNTACFEGGLFHRSVVKKIGIPDPRFFIYWDDTVYGYLASRHTRCVLVEDHVMRRTRELTQVRIGTVRKLSSTSNMNRYYIMRNRAYIAKYFALYGDYHRFSFFMGTMLTFAKENIRAIIVDKNYKEAMKSILNGMKDSIKIYRDKDWKPMPKLDD